MVDDKKQTSAELAAVSRDRLYQEVWSEPMTTVAQKYKVSSSYLARVCTQLNVPRPVRGYWAKLAAGKATKQIPLPEVQPGNDLEWARIGQAKRAPLPVPKAPEGKTKKHRPRSELPKRHPILAGMRERLDEGRESYSGFLKPRKYALVDVIASKDTVGRALDVANELFLLLEERNHNVMLALPKLSLRRHAVDEREKGGRNTHYSDLWSPARPTVVFIGTVAIGLTVFEMTEEVEAVWKDGKYIRIDEMPPQKLKRHQLPYSSTSKHPLPSRRLCIQAYSPYWRAEWMQQWREVKIGDFPGKLLGIVKELEREVTTIARLIEEGERKAEIERREWEAQKVIWAREEAERKRIKAEKDSREELFSIIAAWAEAKKIEEFFADAERRAAELDDDQKQTILERLEMARKQAGSTNALQRFGSWKTPDERCS